MTVFRFALSIFIVLASGSISWSREVSLDSLPEIAADSIRVFLIRHAETYHNADPNMDPSSTLYMKITENGKAQSRAIGKALSDYSIVALYSSETDRTLKTLQLSGLEKIENLKAKQDGAFNQVKNGVKDDGTPGTLGWRIKIWKQDRDPTPKDGESFSDAVRRVFRRIRKEKLAWGKAVVVVTHGDIIAGVSGSADGTSPWERWEKFQTTIGSISVIDITKSGPASLRLFNYSPKLSD